MIRRGHEFIDIKPVVCTYYHYHLQTFRKLHLDSSHWLLYYPTDRILIASNVNIVFVLTRRHLTFIKYNSSM